MGVRTFFLVFIFCIFSGSLSFGISTNPVSEAKELSHLINDISENANRFGNISTTYDQEKLAQDLLNATHEEILREASLAGDISRGQRVWAFTKFYFKNKINLRAFVQWYTGKSRKLGPKFNIYFILSSVTKYFTYVYSIFDPTMAFLVPLSWSHAPNALLYGLMFGIPEAQKRNHTYKRFGGGQDGAENYYKFLVEQKETLPIDWSQVIDVQKIDINVAILKSSKLDKLVPQKWHKYISPRRTAQKESGATLSVDKIKDLAKTLGVDLIYYRQFESTPHVYARLLIKEILEKPEGREMLMSSLQNPTSTNLGTFLDAELILNAKTVEDLKTLGETPNLLAQRLVWYLENRVYIMRTSPLENKDDYRTLRKIMNMVHGDLQALAETPSSSEDIKFEELILKTSSLRFLLNSLESQEIACVKALSRMAP